MVPRARIGANWPVIATLLRASAGGRALHDALSIRLTGAAVVTSINTALLGYLSGQSEEAATKRAQAPIKAGPGQVPQAAVDKAAGTGKAAAGVRHLETAQQALGSELRAALAKAGVKLTGRVEFTVKGDGTVQTKGADADKAAVKAFLAADTSKPTFASRIASQAQDALKLSGDIQQSAAISQAAKLAKTSGAVMSLYNSMMAQRPATSVTFSLSAASSSLTYPGSLSASA